jgi:hypothetical protein
MRSFRKAILLIVTTPLIAAGPARAQSPVPAQPISANRPGFLESTSILDRGQLQLELSGNIDDFSPTNRAWSEPFHVRVGLTDRFEVRMHGNGIQRLVDQSGALSGFGDLTVGGAFVATRESARVPASAVVVYANVPTGARAVRSAATSYTSFVPMSWTIGEGRTLAIMPGVTFTHEDVGLTTVGALAAAVSQSLTERLVVFGEVAGESIRRDASVVTAGGGLAFRVAVRNQVDFGVSRRLTESGPRFRVYVGWSRRLRD